MIRDALSEAIARGKYEVGQRLPSDRELAARFDVSYMTARRAVGELVDADLLERRVGDGTYVRSHSRQRLSQRTIHLICSAYGGAMQTDFLNIGARLIEERDCKHHIIRVHPQYQREAIRALQSDEPALVMLDDPELDGPLGKALMKADNAVLIGNRFDEAGVPSVLADDEKAVRLAVEHLQSAGHKIIALLANHPAGRNESLQIATWRACFPDAAPGVLQRLLIVADTPRFECASRYSYEKMLSWLKKNGAQATALISLDDELALGALAACRDAGRAVPQQLSIVNIAASSKMFYVQPALSCVEVSLQIHLENALEMLGKLENGNLEFGDRLRLVEPQLTPRSSVAAHPAGSTPDGMREVRCAPERSKKVASKKVSLA